ncbi:MAG: hypothetical protein HY201_03790 [Nitrospirae bacterium]|nr:hypothetical protein [Candidatus Troglogloeales bacterium]
MAYTNTLKVFETLRLAFDEKQAAKIAEAVETALEINEAALVGKVATKGDISEVKAELVKVKVELAETKAELIKWMFIFWIGQFASTVGVLTAILFAFFKR